MVAVTSSLPVLVQAPSATETQASAPSRPRARWRAIGFVLVMDRSSMPCRSACAVSVGDEAEVARIAGDLLDPAGDAVDPVDAGQQGGFRGGRGSKPVIRARQFLLRHRPNHIGRYQHHQFGLAADIVLASEKLAEHGYFIRA